MIELLIFIPLSFTIPTIFMWEQFRRAGRKSWETLIPFYNLYVFLKIIKKPWWWYLLLLFPFINVFMYMLMLVEMAKCFGKFGLGQLFLAVLFPFIYFPYLATRPEEKYLDRRHKHCSHHVAFRYRRALCGHSVDKAQHHG